MKLSSQACRDIAAGLRSPKIFITFISIKIIFLDFLFLKKLRYAQVMTVGNIKIDSYSPNEIKLTVNTPLDTFIASSETFDKGWKLKINDKKSDIYNVMNGFRGFIVPDGASSIKMYYIPHNLILGFTLTVIGLIAVFLIFRNKKILELLKSV